MAKELVGAAQNSAVPKPPREQLYCWLPIATPDYHVHFVAGNSDLLRYSRRMAEVLGQSNPSQFPSRDSYLEDQGSMGAAEQVTLEMVEHTRWRDCGYAVDFQ
jgi:hypothetical protein